MIIRIVIMIIMIAYNGALLVRASITVSGPTSVAIAGPASDPLVH